MTNKSRSAVFGVGVLFAILALGMLLVPGWGAGLVLVLSLVVAAGLASTLNPGRQLSQLTVYDR